MCDANCDMNNHFQIRLAPRAFPGSNKASSGGYHFFDPLLSSYDALLYNVGHLKVFNPAQKL